MMVNRNLTAMSTPRLLLTIAPASSWKTDLDIINIRIEVHYRFLNPKPKLKPYLKRHPIWSCQLVWPTCEPINTTHIHSFHMEKIEAESNDDPYDVIIFVRRHDAVIALAELLKHHASTKDVFRVGFLIGTSDSSYRHAMMDITRNLIKDSQENTLADFKIGEKNVIVATSVAEEGLDIQACCSVIRWDPPLNMASWAQSRGRARKKRSTFTVMFDEDTRQKEDVAKWENLEREMVALYTDPSRDLTFIQEEELEMGDDDNDMEFEVASTG